MRLAACVALVLAAAPGCRDGGPASSAQPTRAADPVAEAAARERLDSAKKIDPALNPSDAIIALTEVALAFPETSVAAEARALRDDVDRARTTRTARIGEMVRAGNGRLPGLESTSDDMTRIIWFGAPGANRQLFNDYLKLYFGLERQPDGAPGLELLPLRIKVQYEGEDWVFARRLTFKVDDQLFEFTPDEWNRTNDGGLVWERADESLSTSAPELMHALGKAKSVKIRFAGSAGVHDFQVPAGQIKRAQQVYRAWLGLARGESPPPPVAPVVESLEK